MGSFVNIVKFLSCENLHICSEVEMSEFTCGHFPYSQGGYNLASISESMCVCAAALLGDPLPSVQEGVPNDRSA